jgi:phosphatidylglycerophosphatase B
MRMKESKKKLYIVVLVALLIVGSSCVFPLYLMAGTSFFWSYLWLGVTHLGDAFAVLILVVVLSVFIALRIKGLRRRWLSGVFLGLFLIMTLGALALANEHLIKEKIKMYRPSLLLLHQSVDFDVDACYALAGKKERRQFVEDFLNSIPDKKVTYQQKEVQRHIIDLWKYETAYSFPSGHAVNAFLLAFISSYLMQWFFPDKYQFKTSMIYLLATAISLSRVLLGVHTPLDITFGALWGSFLGMLIVYSGVLKVVIYRNSTRKIGV